MKFYISDTHFGHENIIRHSKRPFANADEMDEKIIANWNSVVGPNDEVYILGDLAYKGSKGPAYYLNRLNGKKYFLIGNHDNEIKNNIRKYASYFEHGIIRDIFEIDDNGTRIVLCHYPMSEWNGMFRGAIHLYGHIHNNTENDTYKRTSNTPNAYNVGADILDFTPRTLNEVIVMNKEFFKNHVAKWFFETH